MKAVKKLVVLAIVSLLASVASASDLEQSYLESCRKDPGAPVPVSVVSPTVSSEYTGSTVELEFVVDTTGKPAQFSIKSTPDWELAVAVRDAVKQWRFKPSEIDGRPVAKKVSLPVRIIDATESGERFAVN